VQAGDIPQRVEIPRNIPIPWVTGTKTGGYNTGAEMPEHTPTPKRVAWYFT